MNERRFDERFGIDVGQEEARRRFVVRAQILIFEKFGEAYSSEVHTAIALKYGDRGHNIGEWVRDDFLRALQGIEIMWEVEPSCRAKLSYLVEELIRTSETNVGIEWSGGEFRPAGAALLDKTLVADVLDWVQDQPAVRQPFEKALRHLLRGQTEPALRGDAITDAYEALEALAKTFTGRDVDLSANCEQFIRKVKVSEEYKRMLKNYIDYACRFRHAVSEMNPRPDVSFRETESFVYLTGLLLRLAIPE